MGLSRQSLAWLALLTLSLGGCGLDSKGGVTAAHLANEDGTLSPGPLPTCSIPRGDYPRPARICGIDGYTYLLRTYLRPHCGGCHFSNSFMVNNAMGDADPSLAWSNALQYTPTQFNARLTNNPNVMPGCVLREGDPVLNDLREWNQNRTVCN